MSCSPSRTASRPGSSTCARRSRRSRRQGEGSAALVRQLNAELQQARIAGGLIALTGTGIVIQLEDSKTPVPPDGSESDYLVGSRDIRVVVEELWGAGAEAIAVNGERITPTSAIIDVGTSLLVNSAYLAPPYQITALGPPDLYDRLSKSRASSTSSGRAARATASGSRWPTRDRSTCRPSSGPSPSATRDRSRRRPPHQPPPRAAARAADRCIAARASSRSPPSP